MAIKGWHAGAHGDETVLYLDSVDSLQEVTHMIKLRRTYIQYTSVCKTNEI